MHGEEKEPDADGNHDHERQTISRGDCVVCVTVFLVHGSVEKPAHHLEQVGQGQDDADHGHDDLERVLVPTADDDHHFGDEVHGAGHADRGHACNHETAGDERHAVREPAEGGNVARVRLIVHPPGHGKEHTCGHGVRKHIHHRAGQADVVQGGHAQKDIPHVTGTGISDDVLGVFGVERDEPAIDDTEHAEHGCDRHEFSGGLRQNLKGHPDDGKMTELHQHARMQHARGGRSGCVAHRRPGVQRPERRNRSKAEEDQDPNDLVERGAQDRDVHQLGLITQDQNVEGIEPRVFVDQQDAHQRCDGKSREKEHQFHRGVFFAVRSEVEDESD
ncbi:MAG: hypothetical protein JW395_3080 [Nitrospira sp.]|nr:hypothetical protein [Nitrospira sp.]